MPSAINGKPMRRRRWSVGVQRRRERRSAATEHAARGSMRRRKRGARIAPTLVAEPGRPPACLCDACIAIANELRVCAALNNIVYVQ